jgi:hypothetical protein
MSKNTIWVRLQLGNDWGRYYLALQPLGRHGTCSISRGIKVVEGEPISIRFPDGTIEDTTITLDRHTEMVSEQGQSSHPVHSSVPAAVYDNRGIRAVIELDQIDVPLDWVKAHEPSDIPEANR